MYESSELLKCVLRKMPNSFFFLSNKKSSYSHFYLSIPEIFFKFLYFSKFCVAFNSIKILFTTNQRKKLIWSKLKAKSWKAWENIHCCTNNKCYHIQGYSGPHLLAFGLNVEILHISPYSFQMQENADQNNPKYGHFLRNDTFIYKYLCIYMYIQAK